jgi:uncharacterized protein HemY
MRFLLYLFLFFIIWFFVKLVLKSLRSSPRKTTIHNGNRRNVNEYDNVEDAVFREIDEEKKNKN